MQSEAVAAGLAAHVGNEFTRIAMGDLSVAAMVGHFDPDAPGVGPQFLENAGTYDERYLAIDATAQKIVGTLKRAGVEGFRPDIVLDVGSGSGNSVFALARLFPNAEIFASDLSPNMVAMIQSRALSWGMAGRVTATVADTSRMRPKPGRFDLVLGSSMLHHLVDPFETLGALLGSLRPGGLAVFYEPFQAGNLILRQCLGEIHRRAPYHGDLPAELVEFIRVCILGLDLMFAEDRVHPVLRSLDDKWMFTRAEFAAAAERYGLAAPVISSTNPAERTWENKLTSLIYSGLGSKDGLPDWVTEVLRSADAHVSPALREEMLMEGEIIFRKPATSSAHGSA